MVYRNMPVPLVVSTAFIVLTCALAAVARRCVKGVMGPSLNRLLIMEFICSADLCGACFELIVVADNYGVWVYGAYLFLLTLWWSSDWGEACACPYIHVEALVMGGDSFMSVILKILAEVLGGVMVYRYVAHLWNLELSPAHVGIVHLECTADLQVPALYGALIEGMATCMCRLTSMALSDMEPNFSNIIDAFAATSLVVAAFNYSGGYFNPALATALKYGCHGNTTFEHISVYWIGATLGSVISALIYPQYLRTTFLERRIKED